MPTSIDVERVAKRATEVLSEIQGDTKPKLRFDKKQVFVRKLVDKIVANQAEMTVSGYLPLGKEDKNYVKFRSFGRNRWSSKCG